MLTKDLLRYRIRAGQVKPTFVDASDPALLSLASSLVTVASESSGMELGELEARLGEIAAGFSTPQVAQGLSKLLVDRITFEEPTDEAPRLRDETFATAAELLRGLADDATAEQYEAALLTAFPDLDERRRRLYGDHPAHRRVLEWDSIDGPGLVHRYNLALVQGLVMRARRLTVEARAAELVRVRRVLRWLKFCRLVGDVQRDGRDWRIDVEGPAEVLSMQKKYGLQLAQFVAVVPVLARWSLTAEVRFERAPATLALDETSPLVSPHDRALGHVPEEIGVIVGRLSDDTWEADTTPVPRTVGTGELCVPDITLKRRDGAAEVAFEFFHRWHRHQLARRLEQLRVRPDPFLFLAVDEALFADVPDAAAHPQVVPFKGFPSERRLRAVLPQAPSVREGTSRPRRLRS